MDIYIYIHCDTQVLCTHFCCLVKIYGQMRMELCSFLYWSINSSSHTVNRLTSVSKMTPYVITRPWWVNVTPEVITPVISGLMPILISGVCYYCPINDIMWEVLNYAALITSLLSARITLPSITLLWMYIVDILSACQCQQAARPENRNGQQLYFIHNNVLMVILSHTDNLRKYNAFM